jgi:hypothetical protein
VSPDDQIRQALDRALAGVRSSLEPDLRALARDVIRAATDARGPAIEAAVTEIRRKAHAQLTQIRDATEKYVEDLRRAADLQINESRQSAAAVLARAEADVEDARRTAQAQVDDVQRAMESRLGDMQTRLAETERLLVASTCEVEDVKKRVAADAEELIVAQLASAAADHQRRQTEAVDEVRALARRLDLEQTARVARAIRMLDEARSLGEVLELLAQGAAREADRVAVLVVRGARLAGWSVMGFGDTVPRARDLDLDVDGAGMLGAAVRSAGPIDRGAAETSPGVSLPPFAAEAGRRNALALPVLVGGTVVAVLYADAPTTDSGQGDRWPSVLDVLARHAGKVLDALTVQQVVALSLPRPVARASHREVAGFSHDGSVQ